MNTLSLLFHAIFLVSSTFYSFATSMQSLYMQDLIKNSHAIVHGQFLSQEPLIWKNKQWTRLKFRIISFLKGDGSSDIEIIQPGGQNGKYQTIVAGTRRFIPEQHYCLFLWNGPENKKQVIGYSQGSFTLEFSDSDWIFKPDSKNYSLQKPMIMKSRLRAQIQGKNSTENKLTHFYTKRSLSNLRELIATYE